MPAKKNPVPALDTELLQSIANQMLTGKTVDVNATSIPVKRTSSERLKNLRFEMNGREYHAIEQNPDKPSRWGQLAREGHHVIQFRDVAANRYVAVSVDGKIKEYGRMSSGKSDSKKFGQ
jgi:hypothetical protein